MTQSHTPTIKFHPSYKMVLSGLSENSFGCGTHKKTVWHARLTEDYKNGRMERKKGDFLCAKLTRSTFDVKDADEWQMGQGVEVNCKACVKALAQAKAGA
jgi:hypothetical protein